MGHLVAKARLQHAQPSRHANRAVRIGQADQAAAAFPPRARAARREHQADRAGVSEQEIVAQLHKIGPLGGRAGPGRSKCLSVPLRLLRQLQDRPSLLIETKQREDREQNGRPEQDGGDARKKSLHPQPEVEPDTAVNPGDEQDRDLNHPQVRP